jgi:hypothetical protein
MTAPSIEILGIYLAPPSAAVMPEPAGLAAGWFVTGDGEELIEPAQLDELPGTVLVEVLVRNRDDGFDAGGFGQA